MKTILIFILSAAVVIQCQKKEAADIPDFRTHSYLEAKTEAWNYTYTQIALVHYTYTGYARVAAKTLATDKGGQPPLGDSCNLKKGGEAYEDAMINFRDARYSMRIEWNKYHLAKKTSVYNQAKTDMFFAQKNYESKLACDEKAFKTWMKKLTKNSYNKSYKGIQTQHWAFYIQVERNTYKAFAKKLPSVFMPGFVQGDDNCGVRNKAYEWIKLQHKTNWLEFKQKFDGGEWLKKGNAAQVLSRAKDAEFQKAVECDKAIPLTPKAIKEINFATDYDIKIYKEFWASVDLAKKRNDPCQLEEIATNFAIVEQTYRFFHHLWYSARTNEQIAKYTKLSNTAMGEQQKVGALWQQALICDAKDVAVKKIAADAAAAAVVAATAELKDGENPEVAKCKAGSTKRKPSPAAKDAAVAFGKAKAVQVGSFQKAKVRQAELHQMRRFDMEVENTFEEHEKNFDVDGFEARRLWVFSN